jgi:hypothetical protein
MVTRQPLIASGVDCLAFFKKTLELQSPNSRLVDTSRQLDGTIQKGIQSVRKSVPIFGEVRDEVHGTQALIKAQRQQLDGSSCSD